MDNDNPITLNVYNLSAPRISSGIDISVETVAIIWKLNEPSCGKLTFAGILIVTNHLLSVFVIVATGLSLSSLTELLSFGIYPFDKLCDMNFTVYLSELNNDKL